MANEIWFKENVSDAEWAAYAQECRDWSKKHAANLQKSYDDDQWNFYSGAISRNYDKEARLADNKGIDWFYRLVDFDGNVVDAKIVDGKFGKVWCVKQADGSVKWVNVSQAKDPKREQAFYESKGYRIAMVEYPCYFMHGESKPIENAAPVGIQYVGEEAAA